MTTAGCGGGNATSAPDSGSAAPEWEERCPICNADEICVLFYDGTCGGLGSGTCVKSTCDSCTDDCNAQLCGFGSGSGESQTFSCVEPCTALPAGYFSCSGI